MSNLRAVTLGALGPLVTVGLAVADARPSAELQSREQAVAESVFAVGRGPTAYEATSESVYATSTGSLDAVRERSAQRTALAALRAAAMPQPTIDGVKFSRNGTQPVMTIRGSNFYAATDDVVFVCQGTNAANLRRGPSPAPARPGQPTTIESCRRVVTNGTELVVPLWAFDVAPVGQAGVVVWARYGVAQFTVSSPEYYRTMAQTASLPASIDVRPSGSVTAGTDLALAAPGLDGFFGRGWLRLLADPVVPPLWARRAGGAGAWTARTPREAPLVSPAVLVGLNANVWEAPPAFKVNLAAAPAPMVVTVFPPIIDAGRELEIIGRYLAPGTEILIDGRVFWPDASRRNALILNRSTAGLTDGPHQLTVRYPAGPPSAPVTFTVVADP